VPDARAAVRFGLLSTARINDAVLRGAAASTAVEVAAVASRDLGRARAYARRNGIAKAHGSYEDLLADPDVEAVYIGLPNGLHVEWTVKALEAGKHVLVEKPFSPRVSDVERAFDLAEARGLVLSEGYMWRHSPQARRLVELLPRIGAVRLVRAAFSFPLDRPGDVRWDPALEGGALMDVGGYCISAARLVLGEPDRMAGFGTGAGVDVRFAGVLRFADGAQATFDCAFDLPRRDELEIVGADGILFLDDPWHGRDPVIEVRRDGRVERIACEPVDAYRLELDDIAAAIRDGRPPLLGRADAVGQARVLQALRA
jgi:predicted dehydrogenase